MNTDWKSLRYRIRTTSLVGVSVYMLGAGVARPTFAITPSLWMTPREWCI
jgi:hypothetical protein